MLPVYHILLGKQALIKGRLNVLVFTLLTFVSLLFKQTTIFYIIYFFWCSEVIRIVVDRISYQLNLNAKKEFQNTAMVFGSFFLMAIYGLFIIVFFGLMANAKLNELMIVNLEILMFKNWFFNINLLFVLAERIYLHLTKQPIQIGFGGFTINMLVLHISIVIGGLLMFLVVKNYPDVFTPENIWGSVIIILPFMLLRILVSHF